MNPQTAFLVGSYTLGALVFLTVLIARYVTVKTTFIQALPGLGEKLTIPLFGLLLMFTLCWPISIVLVSLVRSAAEELVRENRAKAFEATQPDEAAQPKQPEEDVWRADDYAHRHFVMIWDSAIEAAGKVCDLHASEWTDEPGRLASAIRLLKHRNLVPPFTVNDDDGYDDDDDDVLKTTLDGER